MIECICIDDTNRPPEIPIEKWPKYMETYHIIMAVVVKPQNMLAYHLSEINLSDDELPYEYFKSTRFAVRVTDLNKVWELIDDCIEAGKATAGIMEQIEIIENQVI